MLAIITTLSVVDVSIVPVCRTYILLIYTVLIFSAMLCREYSSISVLKEAYNPMTQPLLYRQAKPIWGGRFDKHTYIFMIVGENQPDKALSVMRSA